MSSILLTALYYVLFKLINFIDIILLYKSRNKKRNGPRNLMKGHAQELAEGREVKSQESVNEL